MRHTSPLTISALALTLGLALAGCSSTPSDPPPASSESATASQPAELDAAPAAGASVAGDGYAYSIPVGWAEQDKSLVAGADTIAIDLVPTGDFSNNVNVIVNTSGAIPVDQVNEEAASELESAGATDVLVLDPVTVSGAESAHISAGYSSSGVTYRTLQYFVPKDDRTYIVTFSFAVSVSDDDATGIAESVLASWAWM